MESAYHAVLVRLRVVLESLDGVLAELPDAALDWVPAEGVNSITVLVRHSVTGTAYLAAVGAGLGPDREKYLKGERAASFSSKGGTSAKLRADIATLLDDIGPILGAGRAEVLERPAGFAWADGRTPNCGEVLVHTLGHLQEHAGQVDLLRDLWNARGGTSA
jgi:hypothetical protein